MWRWLWPLTGLSIGSLIGLHIYVKICPVQADSKQADVTHQRPPGTFLPKGQQQGTIWTCIYHPCRSCSLKNWEKQEKSKCNVLIDYRFWVNIGFWSIILLSGPASIIRDTERAEKPRSFHHVTEASATYTESTNYRLPPPPPPTHTHLGNDGYKRRVGGGKMDSESLTCLEKLFDAICIWNHHKKMSMSKQKRIITLHEPQVGNLAEV